MKKELLPLDLQFFAESLNEESNQQKDENANTSAQGKEAPKKTDEPLPEYTVEQLLATVADLKAQNAKQKADFDKLMTSEGNLRKQLRAKQTAEEAEAEAKAEQEAQYQAYVKGLERENKIHKATERFLDLGMDKDLAVETATFEIDENNESVTANFKKFMENREKSHDAEIRQQLLGEMANLQSGNSTSVDYNKQFNEAVANGDMQGAILAQLQQARANVIPT